MNIIDVGENKLGKRVVVTDFEIDDALFPLRSCFVMPSEES